MKKNRQGPRLAPWNEVFGVDGAPRQIYRPLLDRVLSLPRGEAKLMAERLEATMREMGVTFDIERISPWGQRPWFCDLLPQLFGALEWEELATGLSQRLRAFELFLQDVHGEKEILRQNVIPAQPVLGSPYFQRPAVGLPRPDGAFLHLSGAALTRLSDGRMAVSHHYFSNASGISYMMQNRRALSRVFSEVFLDHNPGSIADVPVAILEAFRSLAPHAPEKPVVALLTSGGSSAAYSEHSFLARRMGVPLVQGGDLLVLDDKLYLKSVSGLIRLDVLYTRVADAWVDSMVFRRDSMHGVPGLAQCVRRGTVAVANAMGSQLADDRALLPFSSQIIRFYLGEQPLLPTLSTWWLGDIDQRDHVLDRLDEFDIRPLYGEGIVHHQDSPQADEKKLRRHLQQNPHNWVAQPRSMGATTTCLNRSGALGPRRQAHIACASRRSEGSYDVFPGALTRISSAKALFTSSELGGGSKDTWILGGDGKKGMPRFLSARPGELNRRESCVTARVADAFYWLGRHLERAQSLAYMVGVVESLETEELNRAERQLYRPVWNRMLPLVEQSESGPKRSITTAVERYQLVLDGREDGSILSTLQRAGRGGDQIQECLSMEALGVLNNLESRLARARFRPDQDETSLSLATQRFCGEVTAGIAAFFGMAESTMLADRGWNFCRLGQQFERASITAHAGETIFKSVAERLEKLSDLSGHALEIELSAFLRMLGSRDVYRRVYQMRAEPAAVLELLYANPHMPRSVRHCLEECLRLLGREEDESPGTARTREALRAVLHRVEGCTWTSYLQPVVLGGAESEAGGGAHLDPERLAGLVDALGDIMEKTQAVHHVMTDGLISCQLLSD